MFLNPMLHDNCCMAASNSNKDFKIYAYFAYRQIVTFKLDNERAIACITSVNRIFEQTISTSSLLHLNRSLNNW